MYYDNPADRLLLTKLNGEINEFNEDRKMPSNLEAKYTLLLM